MAARTSGEKVLPGGLFGINNVPLQSEYQWQDIVTSKDIRDLKSLRHRRWNSKLYFQYNEESAAPAAMKQRKAIADALQAKGYEPGFWSEGVAYALFEKVLEEAESFRLLTEVLHGVAMIMPMPTQEDKPE